MYFIDVIEYDLNEGISIYTKKGQDTFGKVNFVFKSRTRRLQKLNFELNV